MNQEKNKYQLDHTVKPLVFELIRSHKNEDVKAYFKNNLQDIHLKGWMSDTPLHIACLSGNFEIVKYLIENGVNVNAERTGIYATPLCWAENLEIAEYLLDHGATMNDLELYMATRQDKIPVIDLLLKRGAAINEEDPQYLQCKSKEAIKIYLDHQIDINGSDSNESNLLHRLAWLDLPEVFDFALQKGVPWKRDTSRRTPFLSAKGGGRNLIIDHITNNYPELISNKIKVLETDLPFEKVSFLLRHPQEPSNYIALTQEGKLINYEVHGDNSLIVTKAIEIDVPIIRNFTIDGSGDLILPTGENKLLIIDAINFELIDTIKFAEEYTFDQITYLPKREIYIGSNSAWELILLTKDFQIISKTDAEDGTYFPIVNEREDLISFLSYDQETFFDLYKLLEAKEIQFVHSFFEDRKSISKSFAFLGDELVVAFPSKLNSYKLQGTELIKNQELNIDAYDSAYHACSLISVSDDLLLFGKGQKLIVYKKSDRIIKIEEVDLKLEDEIRQVHYDKEEKKIIVITNSEIRLFDFREKHWVQNL